MAECGILYFPKAYRNAQIELLVYPKNYLEGIREGRRGRAVGAGSACALI